MTVCTLPASTRWALALSLSDGKRKSSKALLTSGWVRVSRSSVLWQWDGPIRLQDPNRFHKGMVGHMQNQYFTSILCEQRGKLNIRSRRPIKFASWFCLEFNFGELLKAKSQPQPIATTCSTNQETDFSASHSCIFICVSIFSTSRKFSFAFTYVWLCPNSSSFRITVYNFTLNLNRLFSPKYAFLKHEGKLKAHKQYKRDFSQHPDFLDLYGF